MLIFRIFVTLGLFATVPGCDGKQKTLVGELQNHEFLHLDIPIFTVYTHTHWIYINIDMSNSLDIIHILDIRTFIGYINIGYQTFIGYTNIGYRNLLLDIQALDIKTFIGRTNIGYENFIGYTCTLEITAFT